MKTTMHTFSGKLFDFANVQVDQIDIADIARGLARQCRFAGQTVRFYSVAEHSIHCASLARQLGAGIGIQLGCLLHDGHEAYTSDLVRPLKVALLRMEERSFGSMYDRMAALVQGQIDVKFSLPPDDGIVHDIDNRMLHAEAEQMLVRYDHLEHWWTDPARKLVPDADDNPVEACWEFDYYAPDDAERVFLTWFEELYWNGWRPLCASKRTPTT